jgi:hypothetical protein
MDAKQQISMTFIFFLHRFRGFCYLANYLDKQGIYFLPNKNITNMTRTNAWFGRIKNMGRFFFAPLKTSPDSYEVASMQRYRRANSDKGVCSFQCSFQKLSRLSICLIPSAPIFRAAFSYSAAIALSYFVTLCPAPPSILLFFLRILAISH